MIGRTICLKQPEHYGSCWTPTTFAHFNWIFLPYDFPSRLSVNDTSGHKYYEACEIFIIGWPSLKLTLHRPCYVTYIIHICYVHWLFLPWTSTTPYLPILWFSLDISVCSLFAPCAQLCLQDLSLADCPCIPEISVIWPLMSIASEIPCDQWLRLWLDEVPLPRLICVGGNGDSCYSWLPLNSLIIVWKPNHDTSQKIWLSS